MGDQMRSPDGYLPIDNYAVIGDGRSTALVGRDGAIDWLCLPDHDSQAVFAAILDASRGGTFSLAPTVPFEARRRYLPGTNVLETTFSAADGVVRVVDALTLPDAGLAPFRELVRRVEGLSGRVPMRWAFAPRFGYGARTRPIQRRSGRFVAEDGALALALGAWDAGSPVAGDGSVEAAFASQAGSRALLSLVVANQEPLVLAGRADSERRLDATIDFWARWSGEHSYDGPWKDAVIRSGLVLKLLVHAPSGSVIAAPTTSLPEELGGERNWDYRFCWVRDTAYTLDTLLKLGCLDEAHAFFWWLLHASQLTHPRLQVLYRLDGSPHAKEVVLDHLDGYRGSKPARIGNAAAGQRQLDMYGDLLDMALLYVEDGRRLDRDTGGELAEIADLVCELWRDPDNGIWEVRSKRRHFTHSKVMCWVALDRAIKLADDRQLPRDRIDRWRENADAIRAFVETNCWSEELGSYTRAADGTDLDASLLVLLLAGYCDPRSERASGTIDAVRRGLGRGPYLNRYSGEDGVSGHEGAFVTCSFWLVNALVLAGRRDEAKALMEDLLALRNDVGLLAEEIEPRTGDFLGNFPQGLSHLALANAAAAFASGPEGRPS
jgi:GH15 family glucan-1,4-alpha-glucosidase